MKTKKFTLLQLFSVVDGRLSTKIQDVYDILNHVFGTSFFTHQLPAAMNELSNKKPRWFKDASEEINAIKLHLGTNEFIELIQHIEECHNPVFDIPQLQDETE